MQEEEGHDQITKNRIWIGAPFSLKSPSIYCQEEEESMESLFLDERWDLLAINFRDLELLLVLFNPLFPLSSSEEGEGETE